jgi:phosphatidylserine decarboxylase
MSLRAAIARVVAQEDINFLLTNRIPRRLATRFMGRFSRIEQPLVRDISIALWRFFSDVDLGDAAETRFASLHDAFIRRLRPGARPADPDPHILASPCDAIVGAHGRIEDDRLHQIKGFPYTLGDLMGPEDYSDFRDGNFVTLRLTAGMYHRFHAPADLTVESVTYISGDTWNVNPIALKRVERLFCKNERAIIRVRLQDGTPLLLVPVAAILVASIRLRFLDTAAALRDGGSRRIDCEAHVARGEEMGWFEHGSTIILFAPAGFTPCATIGEGDYIRAGQALLRDDRRSI